MVKALIMRGPRVPRPDEPSAPPKSERDRLNEALDDLGTALDIIDDSERANTDCPVCKHSCGHSPTCSVITLLRSYGRRP